MAFVLEKPSRFIRETEEESRSLFELSQRGPSQAPKLTEEELKPSRPSPIIEIDAPSFKEKVKFSKEVLSDPEIISSPAGILSAVLPLFEAGSIKVDVGVGGKKVGIPPLFSPALSKDIPANITDSLKRVGRFIKNRIKFKNVTRNLDPDDIANAFAGRKSSLQAKKFVQELPAGERATVARNALKGEGAEFTETVSRFVKEVPQKAPAVPRGIEPGRPSLGELQVGVETPKAPPRLKVSDPDIIITKGTGLTPDDLPPLQEPRISAELNKRVIKAAEQMFTSGKLPRNPRIKISDNIKELLIEDKIPVPLLKEVLEANNLDLTEFAAGLFRLDTKFFAQQLNLLSQAQRKINNTVLSIDPKMRERIEELVGDTQLPDEFGRAKTSFIKRVENIRLGLMVSQLSTAVRNATTQAGRVGIDIFDQEIQAQLQRIFNVKPVKRISPLDGMEVVQDIVSFKKTAKAVDQILSVFPKQYDQLLGTFMSDIKIQMDKGLKPISVRDKVLNKIDKAVAILNTVNRFQEFTIRRAVFLTRFDQNLRKAGISLEELLVDKAKFDETFLTNMRDKQFREFMMRSLEDSVGQALDVTFAQSPKAGTIARDLLEITKKIPFSSLVVPFPRFMMASIKFNFEFSPLGPLKLLSKAERAKIADGDMKVLSRAIIGTGMLGAAWLMRNSSHGGDETRFYEYKTDDGSIVDLRPFNPFVFYLFLAEVERRRQDGTLNSLTAKDFIIALAGVNVRAGTGLFLVDQLLEGITGISDERGLERAARLLKEFSGEALSGFAVPLQQVQDFYSEFDQNEAIIRERRLEPFKGPTKVKIPVISQTLEPRLSELKKGEIRRRNPAFKQVTGLIIKDKRNEIENAVINLGIPFRVFGIRTGDPGIDQQAKEVMAQLVENDVASIAKEFNRVLASKSHKKRPKLQRTQIRLGMTRALEIALGKARTEAINEVKKRPENIEFLRRKELEKIPKTLRRLISLSSRRRTLQEVAGQ